MKNLALYLKKFSLLTPKEKTVREAFSDTLVSMSLPENSVTINYRGGVVYIKGNGIVRNEILIRQKEIINKLNTKLDRFNLQIDKIVPGL